MLLPLFLLLLFLSFCESSYLGGSNLNLARTQWCEQSGVNKGYYGMRFKNKFMGLI